MNADGLYLVSYYALLLNLKLCCCDYYRRKPAPVLVSLVMPQARAQRPHTVQGNRPLVPQSSLGRN